MIAFWPAGAAKRVTHVLALVARAVEGVPGGACVLCDHITGRVVVCDLGAMA